MVVLSKSTDRSMICSKKSAIVLFCFITITIISAAAQTVKVKKETARVKGQPLEGIAADLTGTEEEISTAFTKYLRTFGKVKQSDGVFVLAEFTVNNSSYASPFYALTRPGQTTTLVWAGINATEWPAESTENINKELEKIIYDFGVKFYRDKIQAQIDESVRALSAVERQQQRLINEDKNLNVKLEENKRQKVQLEQSLETNKLEHQSLLMKLDNNKASQDSLTVAAEQVKKVIEMHKERQRRIN